MKVGQAVSLLIAIKVNKAVAGCPHVNAAGPALEEANELAVPRLADFEKAYPADVVGRTYSPGVKNPDEIFCDGSDENKFCNKIAGEWGDSIPQTGEYCIWALLEFQDSPDFEYGIDQENTDAFNAIFQTNLQYWMTLPDASDHVLAVGYTGFGASAPWPVSSIIFKNGNSFGKHWITEFHRPGSQMAGYGWGWTFRGHYKAVKCDDISLDNPVVNGLYVIDEENVGSEGDFQTYWNQFRSLKDLSPSFLAGDDDECVLDCPVGPCPGPDTFTSAGETKGSRIESMKTGLRLSIN